MFKNLTDGSLYVGEMRPGDREATAEEITAFQASLLPTKNQRIAELLAVRGLTLDSEWQLYAAIAGMQAAASTQGKTEAQLYASNPGYKNAKDLFVAVATERANP